MGKGWAPQIKTLPENDEKFCHLHKCTNAHIQLYELNDECFFFCIWPRNKQKNFFCSGTKKKGVMEKKVRQIWSTRSEKKNLKKKRRNVMKKDTAHIRKSYVYHFYLFPCVSFFFQGPRRNDLILFSFHSIKKTTNRMNRIGGKDGRELRRNGKDKYSTSTQERHSKWAVACRDGWHIDTRSEIIDHLEPGIHVVSWMYIHPQLYSDGRLRPLRPSAIFFLMHLLFT